MKENFESSLNAMLKHEGGFQADPRDPGNANGGMTNLGCTKTVWEEFCGHPVTEQDMRALQPSDVAPLYRTRYWDKVKGDQLPAGVDYVVFDAAINSGPGRAAKWLQECVGATPDGAIGPGTLAAVAAMPAADIVAKYKEIRLNFLKELKTWDTFGRGWERRVNEVTEAAERMVG